MRGSLGFCVMLLLMVCGALVRPAAALRPEEIPPALEPWRWWVLHNLEEELCPTDYDDGAVTRCQWPSHLDLAITREDGRFEQRWLVFAHGWVELPGSPEAWPDAVTLDGAATAVVRRGNRPAIAVTPGEHRVAGRFFWNRIPEMIDIPPSLGLLSVLIDGLRVDNPLIDGQGRLWLQKSESIGEEQARLNVSVFRLLRDTIPMQVETLLRLDVSGKGREVDLNQVLLPAAVPMTLSSRLPARFDDQGHLRVQVRAGRWEVVVTSRLPGPVRLIEPGQRPYGEEIWSFEPRHDLRMVDIQGVAPVEPGQTELPQAWRALPAFLVKSDDRLVFNETRRGDADPSPDRLQLQRILWLDFNGGGFTLKDTISGTLSRSWALSMDAPVILGRVAVDGEDRVITRQGESGAGVELRRGLVNLEADARLPRIASALPAVGWAHDFDQVAAVLNLPPGWDLLATGGVDQVSQSWLQRWTLLDFFVVLIVALAVLKLRSWRWGLVGLAAMALIFHEPGAPRYVWLHLLAVMALLPLLPAGWFRRLVMIWGAAAAIFLLAAVIPFMIHQVRWAIYPQLEPQAGMWDLDFDFGMAKRAVEAVPAEEPAQGPPSDRSVDAGIRTAKPDQSTSLAKQGVAWHQDPDALIPTGPGLPDWQWRTIRLRWNGPVAANQTLKLFLLPPWANLLLALLRVVLLAALIWGLFDWRAWWAKAKGHLQGGAAATAAGLALLILLGPGTAGIARAQDGGQVFPPPALLETLKQRLLEKPDCLPHCADISRLELTVRGDDLQILLKIHSAAGAAVPLPVNRKSWNPDQILMDNAPVSGLMRDPQSGQLWAFVPLGQHTVVMSGAVGAEDPIQIPLPLRPHAATAVAEGWKVTGIHADGSVEASIELSRLQEEAAEAAPGRRYATLPAFLQVERLLQLGLTWQATTTVRRLTPAGTPVVVAVPLLAQESVTTTGVQVDQGQALVTLAADQDMQSFSSRLEQTAQIHLIAPKGVPWTETWILDASPVWHCRFEGIAAIHHQDDSGQWKPEWRPWPGEEVRINVERPKALAGQAMTIDRADLELVPGQRFGKGLLRMDIRSSRGGQHTIELPPQSNLQSVTLNGRTLPIRQEDAAVTVPLLPGAQHLQVQWHQLVPFSMWYQGPPVKIGGEAVNTRVSLQMPSKRWILMVGGPRWGPAVLFWSYFAVLVLAAWILGRTASTPLKTGHWFLLGLGLTQVPPMFALIVVGWLLALGFRERRAMPARRIAFNAVQAGLVLWTLVALVCLFAAVQAGLTGQPEMQIEGNGSHYALLNWTQDHTGGVLPQPWVFSLPVWVFSLLMLGWSLWLAFSLLHWLKWGWRGFSREGLWRKAPPRAMKLKVPTAAPGEGTGSP